MNRNSKKGFTIVELIIVIAVIAVLAAVLIPTFSNLIQKANEAADQMLIKNLNTALKMDTTVSKHETMSQALNATKANGFDVEKIVARATDNKIVWDSVNDCFAYIEKDKNEPTYIPDTKTDSTVAEYQLWTIVNGAKLDEKYSSYLAGTEITGTINATNGVDVGENTGITAIAYNNASSEAKNVVINTNGGMLTVNAPKSTITHYGLADKVVVDDIDTNSYHEAGYVTSYIEAKKGHIVIESTASVSILAVNGDITVDQKSGSELFKVVPVGDNTIKSEKVKTLPGVTVAEEAVTTSVLANMKYGGGQGTSEQPYELYTAAHLAAFAKDVNESKLSDYVNAKLCADVNIGNMAWTPIGNALAPFVGSFDGDNHTISGLTNKGYTPEEALWGITSSAKNTGVPYGLFGVVGAKNGAGKAISIENLKLNAVDIDISDSNNVGALIGADSGAADIGGQKANKDANFDLTIKNITTNGKIVCRNTSGATIGGIIGKAYTGKESKGTGILSIEKCTNNIEFSVNCSNDKQIKLGGIIGYSQTFHINLIECINKGNMNVASGDIYIGGIMSYTDGGKQLFVQSCKNVATMTIADGVKISNCGLLVSRWKIADNMNCSVEGAKVVAKLAGGSSAASLNLSNFYNGNKIENASLTTIQNKNTK